MSERQRRALHSVSAVAAEFREAFGRDSGGLLRPYRIEDAEVVLVVMGSAWGTAADAVDRLRQDGVRAGVLGVTCYRPWPFDELHDMLTGVPQVVVVNRAVAPGSGGILSQDVRLAAPAVTTVHEVVMGLGGRAITRARLVDLLQDVLEGREPAGVLDFRDLDREVAHRELAREES
jgi:pyruvate ferredoxin oxidoreductase alpha subunit